MLQQPANYTLPQTPPSESFLRGLGGGYGIGNALKQNADSQALAQQEAERKARFDAAWEKATSPGATSKDMAEAVMLADPQKAKILQDALNQMDGDRRGQVIGQAGAIYMALDSGNTKIGKQLIEQLAEEQQNSGRTQMANHFNTLAATVDQSPEYAKSVALSYLMASPEGHEAFDRILERKALTNETNAQNAQIPPELYGRIKSEAVRPDGSFDPIKGYQMLSEAGIPQKQQDTIIKSLNSGYPASQRASQEVIDILDTPPGKRHSTSRQELSEEVFTKIPNFERMEKLLVSDLAEFNIKNGKVITGPFAESRLFLAKIANAIGLPNPTSERDVAATEAYLASSVQATANIVKQFGAGTGISDADREFAAKAAGGQISMSREALQSITNAAKMAVVNKVIAHNSNVAKVARNTPGETGKAYFDMQAFTEDEFSTEIAALMKEAGAFDMNVKVLNKEEGERIRAMIDSKPAGGGANQGSQLPLITTQQDYDSLPSGSLYMEEDGKTYRKP